MRKHDVADKKAHDSTRPKSWRCFGSAGGDPARGGRGGFGQGWLVVRVAGVAGFVALVMSGCGVSGHGQPTYYVDAAHGQDSNSGASPTSAFRTLAAVGRHSYRGGETILLHGGQRFVGSIGLGPGNL